MPRTLPSEDWSALCDRVDGCAGLVSWRWSAVRDGSGGWNLVALVVDIGGQAEPLLQSYPSAILGVEDLSSEVAAERLREGHVAGSETEAPEIPLPVPQNVVPQWIYSWEEWGLANADWPQLVAETGAGTNAHVEPQLSLLAPELPFYPSLSAAVAEKVFCVSPGRLRLGQHAPVSVRIADRRGRIAKLEAGVEGVLITVEEGEPEGLRGFSLRVAWREQFGDREWVRSNNELLGPGEIKLATDGVPAELVGVLVDPRGFEVDRRSWDERFDTSTPEPESLEALVARWLQEGEHAQVEYKQALSDEKTRVSLAETVAAFANGSGGVVLVGVDDSGVPVGYDAEKASDQVTNIISDRVEELPEFVVDEIRIEGKPLVVVRVAPSALQRRPHQVKGRVMVRSAATTRPATPAQVRELTNPVEPRFEG